MSQMSSFCGLEAGEEGVSEGEVQWEKVDLAKLGLGNLQHIKSLGDLVALAKDLDPQENQEKRQAILYKVFKQIFRGMHRIDYETRTDPNLKFVPTDSPIFFPDCSCDWQKFTSRCNDSAMLPNLEDKWVEVGDIIVYNPFRREAIGKFYDYSEGFQFQFMQKFMTLPKEIRQRIYELVAFGWSPDGPYPVNVPAVIGKNFKVIEVARRNKVPCFLPKPIDESFETDDTRRRFELSYFVEHKAGLLDYFKASEYMNLQGFLEALRKFEGRTGSFSFLGTGELHDIRRMEHIQLGVLNDFLDWLWDNVMLDLSKYIWKERLWTSYEEANQMDSVPCDERNHHRRISHITFSTRTPDEYFSGDVTSIEKSQGLVYLCQYIKNNLHDLRTILAFFRLSPKQAHALLEPGEEPAWLFAINNNLPVVEKFEYHVLVNDDSDGPYSKGEEEEKLPVAELNRLTDLVTEKLKETLKPKVLERIDNPTS